MRLDFNLQLVSGLRSGSQISRVLTESWVGENMFCPRCGNPGIEHFPNNQPVADFFCPVCRSEYELKSQNGPIKNKIADGAYETMIQRITGNRNPDFFFLAYAKEEAKVTDFVLVLKHFFVPEIIEKRKPLADTARRAGWIGCSILLDRIPRQGRINVISGGIAAEPEKVLEKVAQSQRLETSNLTARGWLMDVLNCVNQIRSEVFTLSEVYAFEEILGRMHPENHNVQAKIRQQLQFLRDRGFIEFLERGTYRKI